jgi:hypothetical protein
MAHDAIPEHVEARGNERPVSDDLGSHVLRPAGGTLVALVGTGVAPATPDGHQRGWLGAL